MIRFKLVMLEVYNLDQSVAMLAMKRGFHTSYFTCSMDKKHSRSYLELLTCVHK